MKDRNVIFRWFLVVFGPFLLLGIGLLSQEAQEFSLSKIRPTQRFSLQRSQPNSVQEIAELKEILSQPFTYLTEEKETYVFVSKDDKYVIKFFNIRKMTPKYWLRYIPFPWLEGRRLRKIEEREKIRDEISRSLKLSFDRFRYQTGLVFLHLFKTDYLNAKVCVKDRWGISHYIPLDTVPFIVQRKVDLLKKHIDSLIEKSEEEEAIRGLCGILELVKEACQHGLYDASDDIETHYGFILQRPVLVYGRLTVDESVIDPGRMLKEVFRVSRLLESFVAKHYPQLLASFQREIDDFLMTLEEGE